MTVLEDYREKITLTFDLDVDHSGKCNNLSIINYWKTPNQSESRGNVFPLKGSLTQKFKFYHYFLYLSCFKPVSIYLFF